MGESRIDGAGEGVFAVEDVEEGTTVCLYGGVRMTKVPGVVEGGTALHTAGGEQGAAHHVSSLLAGDTLLILDSPKPLFNIDIFHIQLFTRTPTAWSGLGWWWTCRPTSPPSPATPPLLATQCIR